MGEGFLCVLKGEEDLNRTVACVMAFQENASHTTSMWNLTVQSYPGNTGLTVSQAVSIRPSEIIFGFCRADLSYDVEDSDLETPKDIVINCEVFNLKDDIHSSVSFTRNIHRSWCEVV
ncbi:histidine-rich glycoprotein [Delphinus delphis]|uniref:histidine-rich glycoprotein n=1 Tax=Delphinus delphis TaxID=9728 RepID=UPI0028C3B289|nr:histidine-rich glycoprotein-like [Delphinus delphis]